MTELFFSGCQEGYVQEKFYNNNYSGLLTHENIPSRVHTCSEASQVDPGSDAPEPRPCNDVKGNKLALAQCTTTVSCAAVGIN